MSDKKEPKPSLNFSGRRLVLADPSESMPSEAEQRRRMREHMASKAAVGPCVGISVRENLRSKIGYDAAAALIRSCFDLAEKGKRRGTARNTR